MTTDKKGTSGKQAGRRGGEPVRTGSKWAGQLQSADWPTIMLIKSVLLAHLCLSAHRLHFFFFQCRPQTIGPKG